MKGTSRLICLRALLCLSMLFLSCTLSWAADTKEENNYCFQCHSEKGSVKRFSDGTFVSTYIDRNSFEKSTHGSLRCSQCHKDFSVQNHPKREFRSKLQYQIKSSYACRECHSERSIKSKSIHNSLFAREKEGKPVVCTDCHSAHAVMRIGAGTISIAEERYCLECHAQDRTMTFKNGETLSIKVHITDLRQSPHRNLSCSDCHLGYSRQEHPKRHFRSMREYRIANADNCKKCHFDKFWSVSESIHYSMINVGRLDAPTCIDCHGGHATASMVNNRLSVVNKCKTCHGYIYDMYAKSVHGKALYEEDNRDAPSCIDCHTAHKIKLPTTSEFHNQIPEMCSHCHSNPNIMNKYGLSVDVVKTYLTDFHGVALKMQKNQESKRYKPEPPMAVCTDCHGTHDIVRATGANVQIIRNNLLKQCRSCHARAKENFPDAWLSHYKPSLTHAPAVFMAEQFYKIMMPIIILGILFHVLLHIWRYLIDR